MNQNNNNNNNNNNNQEMVINNELDNNNVIDDEEEEDGYIDEDDLIIPDERYLPDGTKVNDEPDFMEEDEVEEENNNNNVVENRTNINHKIEDNVTKIMPYSYFKYHADAVYSVALSNNGQILATGSGDEKSYLVQLGNDLQPKLPPLILTGHKDSVIQVSFNFDSTLLATGSLDGTIRIYQTNNGQFLKQLDGPSEIEWFQWHFKANIIVAGSSDATGWLWNVDTGTCMCVLGGHLQNVTCGGFTPNGKRILTGSVDGTVRLWDPNNGQCLHTFSGHGWHEEGGIVSITFHPTEPMFASGGEDGTICVVRLDSKKIVSMFRHGKGFTQQRIIKNQQNDDDGDDQNKNENEDTSTCSIEAIGFCTISPWLASGSSNGSIKIWDMLTNTCRTVFNHDDAVVKISWIPNRTTFISCSSDFTTRLWDARSSVQLGAFLGHTDMILDFALFLPSSIINNNNSNIQQQQQQQQITDGAILVTAGDDYSCNIYKIVV